MYRATHFLGFRVSSVFASLLAVTSFSTAAQQPMNEAQMRKMMEQGQKMQECMSKVDPGVMETLQRKGQAFAAEIDALCAAGERDEAQDKAMEYGKEIAASPELKQARKCGEMMRGAAMEAELPLPGDGKKGRHVCD